MKECFKCGEEKPLSEFYKHDSMPDGHVNKCKECNKKDVQLNYRKNIKHFKMYDLERNIKRRDYIKKKNADYQTKNPEKVKAAKRRWALKNKDKIKAQSKLRYWLKKGKVKQANCEVCNSEKTEAHHDDYSKPLDVRWFCKRCHEDHHIEARRNKIESL